MLWRLCLFCFAKSVPTQCLTLTDTTRCRKARPSGQIPRVDLTSDEVFFTSQLAPQAAIKINNGPTLSLPTSQWIIRGVSFYVKYSIDPTKPMPENSLRFFSGYDGVIPEELLFDFGAGRKEALQLCSRRPKFQFEALKNCPVS